MKIKLDYYAVIPERAHETDAGIDIKTPQDFMLEAHGACSIRTGVHVQIPHGMCGLLVAKSGLNVKKGIVSTGLIDEGYTGEIVVKLDNLSDNDHLFRRGDKISQLVIIPVVYEDIQIVDSIEGGERGADGFGSTGP